MIRFRKNIGEKDDPRIEQADALYYYFYSIGTGSIGISTFSIVAGEKLEVLKRFRNVFTLAYQRYTDIAQAEAQAREAEIELALERVRARTMAMQHSNELADASFLLDSQIRALGIKTRGCAFNIYGDNDSTEWFSSEMGTMPTYKTPRENFFLRYYEEGRSGKPIYVETFAGEACSAHYDYLCTLPVMGEALKELKANGGSFPVQQTDHVTYFKFGYLLFVTLEPVLEAHDIFKRFANVFEQTYTRFLDLQKAEAQAREAQIEAALERVRSRAMAMQTSNDINTLIGNFFIEFTKLDIALTRCFILIYDTTTFDTLWYMTNSEVHEQPVTLFTKHDENPFMLAYLKAWQKRQLKLLYLFGGEEKKAWADYYFSETEFKLLPEIVKEGMRLEEKIYQNATFQNFGNLSVSSNEPLSDEKFDILVRFGKVFDLTYTRYNDLQKAEAQAREAQIEAALEKVRSRTMAMQSSNELQETAAVLFQEFKKLGTDNVYQVTIGIYDEDEQSIDFRVTSWAGSGEQENRSFNLDMHEPTVLQPSVAAWKANKKSLVVDLTGEALEGWINYRNKMSGVTISSTDTEGRRVISIAYFSKGHISISTPVPVPQETIKTLERFAAVFDGTYTRFLDLEKAEAQAKEAQIETALERVRSRTLAMQKSDELAETAAEVFRQLIGLGIEPNRLYIGIVKEETGDMEMWATDEDGTQVGKKFMFNKNENISVKKLFDGWKANEKSVIVDMQAKELEDYFHYLNNVMHIPFKGGLTQKRRVQSVAYFSKGFIGMASPDGQGDETILLLERFAAVFNLTFTRFNDLKIAEAHAEQAELDLIAIKEAKQKAEEALTELQATQKQLVQSEKMASLGELTAGIAHEIQNPLNFVNNFSELSNELMDEMNAEIEKGDFEEAKLIANDIKQNLEKINHHGKRADAIVKGMLQHSRSSNGAKEPTDINKLADEYLRLAYHGLRAKDKSFNATLQTNFDDSIGNINIIPQDMGRVILNLITNAFYVVNEKALSAVTTPTAAKYEPTVSVGTKKLGDTILISVKDNGNGIPPKVLDKIFQPFFTTKPTGQGTGLGLSLSYDIVKAHGGELRVETKEGEGTEFIIQLPVV